MSLCYLRCNMQPKPKPLSAGTNFATEERLKKLLYRRLRNWLPTVRDRQFELSVLGCSVNANGLVGRAVAKRIPNQI